MVRDIESKAVGSREAAHQKKEMILWKVDPYVNSKAQTFSSMVVGNSLRISYVMHCYVL